jgi:hypothetical protein
MELRDALDQIHDIRSQLARTLTFRGYRAASTAFTAIVAIVAAIAQALWAGDGRRLAAPVPEALVRRRESSTSSSSGSRWRSGVAVRSTRFSGS